MYEDIITLTGAPIPPVAPLGPGGPAGPCGQSKEDERGHTV